MCLFNEQIKSNKTADYKIAKIVMQQGKQVAQKWEMKKGKYHICQRFEGILVQDKSQNLWEKSQLKNIIAHVLCKSEVKRG